MVQFRLSKIDDFEDVVYTINNLIPTRKKPSQYSEGDLTIISAPSVNIEFREIIDDTKIPKRAFWVNVSGTRKRYIATLIAETLVDKGIIVDSWL